MNKPEWKDAPDWAQWLAMDANGDWYWYELEPDYNGEEWEHIGVIRASAILEDFVTDGTPLYAAPVSEAKPSGVVLHVDDSDKEASK